MIVRMYGDNFLLEKLENMKREISTDIDRHEEHRVLEYALEELHGLYDEIDRLEEVVYNLDEELVSTETIYNTLEEYFGWNMKQLRNRAEVRGLKTSGTKKELVSRLFEDNRVRGELN